MDHEGGTELDTEETYVSFYKPDSLVLPFVMSLHPDTGSFSEPRHRLGDPAIWNGWLELMHDASITSSHHATSFVVVDCHDWTLASIYSVSEISVNAV